MWVLCKRLHRTGYHVSGYIGWGLSGGRDSGIVRAGGRIGGSNRCSRNDAACGVRDGPGHGAAIRLCKAREAGAAKHYGYHAYFD
jgi:hypothetical protein